MCDAAAGVPLRTSYTVYKGGACATIPGVRGCSAGFVECVSKLIFTYSDILSRASTKGPTQAVQVGCDAEVRTMAVVIASRNVTK